MLNIKTKDMKKSGIVGMLMFLMMGTASIAGEVNHSNAAEGHKNGKQLVDRLHEIKAMDIKHMDRDGKKSLRKEVITINKELRTREPVLYISLGAALLVVLLLLLLL